MDLESKVFQSRCIEIVHLEISVKFEPHFLGHKNSCKYLIQKQLALFY